MNLLIENGMIEELECDANFAYVLKDNSLFLATEYKVMQSQSNSSVIKCMKMLCNGMIELYYLVSGYKPFSSLIASLDPESFVTITGNLLAGIIEVKNNGFLSCNSIDSSFEHVFVDRNTFKVGLIYLPLSKHEFADSASFENAVRTNLVRLIAGTSSLSSPKTMQLGADLQNGMLSIEDIYARFGVQASPGMLEKTADVKDDIPSPQTAALKLVTMNATSKNVIKITGPEFTIGRKETNDGVITFNKMVSRYHCKISSNGQEFRITDLQSSGGTFVNGRRLHPNEPVVLKNGDIVSLANSSFQVVIE